MLTTRVMASRTNAAYIRTGISLGLASGKLLANSAAKVLAGENNDTVNRLAFPTSIASAIVSPKARPKPSTIPPNMPREAVGNRTPRIVSHLVAPRPSAAIRSFGGTATRASRLIAGIGGRIIMESTNTAGSITGPHNVVEKNGIHQISWWRQLATGGIKGMNPKIPHKP